jgi:hypothetical protein
MYNKKTVELWGSILSYEKVFAHASSWLFTKFIINYGQLGFFQYILGNDYSLLDI